MARGSNEHRMVFDIRGRRGVVVKVVYAILALLMVASLFLVTGAINIGSILGNSSSGESASSSFEKEAERIETKLEEEPGEEKLLGNLTRARMTAATSLINEGAFESRGGAEEVQQQYALGSEAWSKYAAASVEPSAGVAGLAAPGLFEAANLAVQLSGDLAGALEAVTAASEAQEILVKKQPSLNSWTNLSNYLLFKQDYKGAREALIEAKKFASNKFQRESLENTFKEVEKNAKQFGEELKSEKATKSKSERQESLESPLQGLGGVAGPTGLSGE